MHVLDVLQDIGPFYASEHDEAAVLGFYAMSGFFIREYLTSDRNLLGEAIAKAVEAPPSRGEFVYVEPDEVERKQVRGISEDANASPTSKALRSFDSPRPFSDSVVINPGSEEFVRRDFVERLKDLAGVFRTIPGPKSLVLFTSRDLGAAWEQLGKMFGDAGTSVFAVNTQDWYWSSL